MASCRNGTFSPANREEHTGGTKVRKNRPPIEIMRLGTPKSRLESPNHEIREAKPHAATNFKAKSKRY